MALTSQFWIKNGLKVGIWDFSTREDLRLVHQDHFENTARAGKNIGVPNLGENCGVLPRGSPQPRNFTAKTPDFHWYLNLTQNQPRYRWKNWNLSQTSIKSKNKSEKYNCSEKYRVQLHGKMVFYQFQYLRFCSDLFFLTPTPRFISRLGAIFGVIRPRFYPNPEFQNTKPRP